MKWVCTRYLAVEEYDRISSRNSLLPMLAQPIKGSTVINTRPASGRRGKREIGDGFLNMILTSANSKTLQRYKNRGGSTVGCLCAEDSKGTLNIPVCRIAASWPNKENL